MEEYTAMSLMMFSSTCMRLHIHTLIHIWFALVWQRRCHHLCKTLAHTRQRIGRKIGVRKSGRRSDQLESKVFRLLLEGRDAVPVEGSQARAIIVLCPHVGVVEDAQRLKIDRAHIVSEVQAVGVIHTACEIPERLIKTCVLRGTAE